MNRNDGGTPRGDLTRASVAATAEDNGINPGDYWRRASSSDNYQFTGDGKTVVAAAQNNDSTQKTYKVTDKDSLWSIASKLVKESDCKDKSDKFKLDVVKGLVEKNKDTYKSLEAKPDVIKGGWVLKIDSPEELAKLGHGKTLNTTYKPPSEREKDNGGSNPNKTKDCCPPGQHKNHGGRRADYSDQYSNQQYGDQYRHQQRQMDMGPMKDIMGMVGMMAGSAILGNVLGNRNHHHHRPYYDDYRGGYYDGGYYGHQQHRYPNYTQFRQQQYQHPYDYSHYGRPQQGYVVPINQSNQFRMQPHQHQRHQWHQYHRHT